MKDIEYTPIDENGEEEFLKEAAPADIPAEEKKEEGVNTEQKAVIFNEPEPGRLITGEVVKITKEFIAVDINYKNEALLYSSDVGDLSAFKLGDKVTVYVIKIKNDGEIEVSYKKAGEILGFQTLQETFNSGLNVKGSITEKTKGGFIAYSNSVKCFVPASHAWITDMESFDSLFNKELEFKVIEVDPKTKNAVLSLKKVTEEKNYLIKKNAVEKMQVGDVLKGKVKKVYSSYAFIEINGMDVFLSIRDLKWGRVRSMEDELSPGQEIDVKVIDIDREKLKVNVGVKQLSDDPWMDITKKYSPGEKVKGKITNVTNFGLFAEVEDGITGLIPFSEISWTEVKNPEALYKTGDTIECCVLDVNPSDKKIGLSVKSLTEDPFLVYKKSNTEGSVVTGEVISIKNDMVVVRLNDIVKGILRRDDIDWNSKNIDPSQYFKRNTRYEFKILGYDMNLRKAFLGRKQLHENPYEALKRNYPEGSVIKGRVTKILDFGLFVNLVKDIDGLVHISQIDRKPVHNLSERFKVGDEVLAKVTKIDADNKKISLSIKDYLASAEKEEYLSYIKKQQNKSDTLGDLFEINLNIGAGNGKN